MTQTALDYLHLQKSSGSGKWGEGLKMIAAAALRSGETLELRSRNWMATPFFSNEILNEGQPNEKKIKRLNFTVKKETKEDGISLDDGDAPSGVDHGYSKRAEKSSTTFVNPSPELLNYFRNIDKYILYFSKQRPMIELGDIDILDMQPDKGSIYIKDIYIPGDHQTMYSYNLKGFNIETRDRNAITHEAMKVEIRRVLEGIEDTTFIRLFLSDAKSYADNAEKNEGQIFLEFLTQFDIPTKTELADKWIDCFQKYFGEKTCIRSMSSTSYSEAKAMHMGYKTVALPDTIAKMLYSIETRDGRSIPDYRKALNDAISNAIPFPDEDLTEEDRSTIQQLYQFAKDILPMSKYYANEIKHINIYTYPDDYDGDKAAGYAHYGDTINLDIDTIRRGIRYALDTMFHESGHAETGATDEAPEFRDYQTDLLAAVTLELSELQKSITDNGCLTGATLSDFMKKYKELTNKLAIIQDIATKGLEPIETKNNDEVDIGE